MKEIKTLEEICSEYKLPEDERNEIGNKINAIMLNGKEPSEHPIAIIKYCSSWFWKNRFEWLCMCTIQR